MAAGILRAVIFIFVVFTCTGAQFRTPNFIVEAPDSGIAQQIGQYSEYWRKVKALEWLGQEMPTWPEPCPIHVKITLGGSGGATSFVFEQGQILGIDMQIEGTLDRILASVLPHEITHTVFAHHFRRPLPRWADEGGCVLSEDDLERERHDQMVREILNTPNRRMPLRRLFALTEYPNDVMVLYAQGFSVSQFLVARSNRQIFLAFIGTGMQMGWDRALKSHYGFPSIESLEEAWLQSLRNTKAPNGQLASRLNPQVGSAMASTPTPAPGMNPGNLLGNQLASANVLLGAPLPGTTLPTKDNKQIFRAAAPESGTGNPSPGVRLGPPKFANGKQAIAYTVNAAK